MVASDIPCLRARSAVFVPASCSFNTAIICSSVNLARFICPSFFRPDSNSIWRKYSVAGHALGKLVLFEVLGGKEDAMEFLQAALAGDPVPATEVNRMARERDLTIKAIRSAREALGVKIARNGFGPGSRSLWSLPGRHI